MRQAGELAKKVAAVAEKAKSQEPCSDKKPPIPERIKPAPKPKTLLPARYKIGIFLSATCLIMP
jgi:hypothetical protein